MRLPSARPAVERQLYLLGAVRASTDEHLDLATHACRRSWQVGHRDLLVERGGRGPTGHHAGSIALGPDLVAVAGDRVVAHDQAHQPSSGTTLADAGEGGTAHELPLLELDRPAHV